MIDWTPEEARAHLATLDPMEPLRVAATFVDRILGQVDAVEDRLTREEACEIRGSIGMLRAMIESSRRRAEARR